MQYTSLPPHDAYMALCQQHNYATVRRILVERVAQRRVARAVAKPTVFRCFAVKTQHHCKAALRKKIPLLSCRFQRWTGLGHVVAEPSGTPIGIIRPCDKDCYAFEVNGQRVLTVTVQRETKTACAQYRLQFHDIEYAMAQPYRHAKTGQYTLKYTLLKTKRFGEMSTKNFCFEDTATRRRMLECIKYATNYMFSAFESPFNVVVAAVLAMIRYRVS